MKTKKEINPWQERPRTFEEKLDVFLYIRNLIQKKCDGDIEDGYTMRLEDIAFSYDKKQDKWLPVSHIAEDCEIN